MSILHYFLVYTAMDPLGIMGNLLLCLSIGWIVFMTSKIKKSYRLWLYYRDYYKYNPEYSDVIVFHKNSFVKNVLIFMFLCVDVLLFVFIFTGGVVSYLEKMHSHHNSTYISENCRIEGDTWINYKFNPNHPEVSVIESIWQVLAICEICIFNLLHLVLIQTYSHRPLESENLIKLTVVYLPIELVTIFVLNVFRGTVLFGRFAFAFLLELHMIVNAYYSLKLWRRLKRYKIDLSYFVDRDRREFIVFGRVIARYKWITILNTCLLQFIAISVILFTIVNVFGETIVLNPCWFKVVYGIELPPIDINTHVFRAINYIILCIRDWSITLYMFYILIVQGGILVSHVVSKCYRKPTVFGFTEITTPLCQGNKQFGVS